MQNTLLTKAALLSLCAACLALLFLLRQQAVRSADLSRTLAAAFAELEMLHGRHDASRRARLHSERIITNGEFLQRVATEEERESLRQFKARRQKGEYLLESERPGWREGIAAFHASLVAETASNNLPAYAQIYSSFGVPPEIADALQNHLSAVHLASLRTETHMKQLLAARAAYDERIKSLLTPENYAKYRRFEDSKLARNELDKLQVFLKRNGYVMDPSDHDATVELIRQSRAFTEEYWHGPYDGLPGVIVGKENVISHLQSLMQGIEGRRAEVAARARDHGFSDEFITLLSNYYASEAKARADAIEGMRNHQSVPIEERIRRLKERPNQR